MMDLYTVSDWVSGIASLDPPYGRLFDLDLQFVAGD